MLSPTSLAFIIRRKTDGGASEARSRVASRKSSLELDFFRRPIRSYHNNTVAGPVIRSAQKREYILFSGTLCASVRFKRRINVTQTVER